MENVFLMKLSNDMEKHEIEVTKIGKNYSIFLQCAPDLFLYKIQHEQGHTFSPELATTLLIHLYENLFTS